jgi:hypothetical protein
MSSERLSIDNTSFIFVFTLYGASVSVNNLSLGIELIIVRPFLDKHIASLTEK